MEEEFWKYWKKRWPNASGDHNKIKGSANYQETRAAFEAGYETVQYRVQSDAPTCKHEHVISNLNISSRVVCLDCGETVRR